MRYKVFKTTYQVELWQPRLFSRLWWIDLRFKYDKKYRERICQIMLERTIRKLEKRLWQWAI